MCQHEPWGAITACFAQSQPIKSHGSALSL